MYALELGKGLNKMEFYFYRHGKTKGNAQKRYVGRTDESITKEAEEELRLLKAPLVEAVFSSPLKRCRQTCGILFPDMEPEFIDGLMETDFGDFEYKNHEELKNSRQYINWLKSGGKGGFPSGESFEGFKSRCMEAFYFITGKMEEAGINSAAVVTHGGGIMAVFSRLSQKNFYDFHIDNGGCIYGRFNKYKNIFEDIRIL